MKQAFIFDDRDAERVEAAYMTPDVVDQRQILLEVLDVQDGEEVLDIGSGPGFLASQLANKVGPSGRVCGVDNSESMIAMSSARCAHKPWVKIEHADAMSLPLEDESFDVVTASQVLEYVPDIDAALGEMFRVLRPQGRAVMLDTDWESIVWNNSDGERMRRVLDAWSERLAHPRLPRSLGPAVRAAGFNIANQQVINLFNPDYDANTYSDALINAVVGFVVGRRGVDETEAAAWAADLRDLGSDGQYFFSLSRYLLLAIKPGPEIASD